MIKLNQTKIKQILETRFQKDSINSLKELPNPFEFKDMLKSVNRIISAINKQEKIFLVGDYDVDGITSRVILQEFFDYIDYPLQCITPDRFKDGYGISIALIKNIDADVIITVDNGINAVNVANYCKEQKIDLIITDHHTVSVDMSAFSIINPKQKDCPFPYKDICGAQIAWYLVAGLKNKLELNFDMSSLLDLLVMAIIADVMPLLSLNRTMVKKALKVFNNSSRASILAIKEVLAKSNISSEDIAFLVAPKINVAGRVKNASLAIDFLSETSLEIAIDKFKFLSSLIEQRRDFEEHIFQNCDTKIKDSDQVICIYDESFHEGVLGIVASRIADSYKKIAIIGTLDKSSNIIKMSARSYAGADIYSLINASKENLIGFGGHTQAAGLSLNQDDFTDFHKQLNDNFIKQNIKYNEDKSIMGILNIDDINYELMYMLEKYEPYGHQNEKAKFLVQNVSFHEIKKIGEKKNHLRLIARNKYGFLNMVFFKYPLSLDARFDNKEKIFDIVCTIGRNEFKDNVYLNIQIEELRLP